MSLTAQQRQKREEQIKDMLKRELSLSEMSRELGVTSQSIHKFLVRRGWETKEMKDRRLRGLTVKMPPSRTGKRIVEMSPADGVDPNARAAHYRDKNEKKAKAKKAKRKAIPKDKVDRSGGFNQTG